jgi:hypothetical protein
VACIINIFVQLGFSMSNGVTDTLEPNSILIYFQTCLSIYTQKGDYNKHIPIINDVACVVSE